MDNLLEMENRVLALGQRMANLEESASQEEQGKVFEFQSKYQIAKRGIEDAVDSCGFDSATARIKAILVQTLRSIEEVSIGEDKEKAQRKS